jgi:hypothetical protein
MGEYVASEITIKPWPYTNSHYLLRALAYTKGRSEDRQHENTYRSHGECPFLQNPYWKAKAP